MIVDIPEALIDLRPLHPVADRVQDLVDAVSAVGHQLLLSATYGSGRYSPESTPIMLFSLRFGYRL
jgi:hypothetical protein